MLAHVNRQEMLVLASQAAKAAPKSAGTQAEAIKGIHLEADSRRSMLTLTATNYEVAIRTSMAASVEESGSCVVSDSLLPAVLSKLPEEDVDLEIGENGRLTICSGDSRFRLDVIPGEKYPMPELPFPDDTLPVSGLCSLARSTVFAAAEDATQMPQMKCIQLLIGPEGLTASASNGFCVMQADGDKACRGHSELLLPAHSLKVLASISKDSDVYEMGLAGKSLVFWSGTLLFSARLMEGRFPEIGRLLEQFKGQYSVHLDADELRHAIESVAAVAEQNARIELAFGEHEITLSAESSFGRSSAPVKALVLSAPAKPFYYNYKKLLEYLSLAKGKITLEFDPSGLLAIRPGSTRYLQSPMRPPTRAASGKAA